VILRTLGPVPHIDCGKDADLVIALGRIEVTPKLLGMPAMQYHVECRHCQLATQPVYHRNTAMALWRQSTPEALHPIAQLPTLRLQAERLLAAACTPMAA
jgi:hypothetical protein